MIIALDANGGDFAPEQTVEGAVEAAEELDATIALVGREDQLQAQLEQHPPQDNIVLRPASEVVQMTDSARVALRDKPDSSMARTVQMVASGEADACVSAGNSGGYMALCHIRLKTVRGIDRPASCVAVPTTDGVRAILDVGANADCKPEYLLQFGVMGTVYAQSALDIEEPGVGLLSIGTEAHKGTELVCTAKQLLEASSVNFLGNVEGDQLFDDGGADVIVCDGFAGNIVLKVTEGTANFLFTLLKQAIDGNWKAKIGGALLSDVFSQLENKFHYGTYGGALLLGVNGICVVAHGKSDANAIKNAIHAAHKAANGELVRHLQKTCERMLSDPTIPAPAP